MDQELKARKLASVAARKQRFAERQRQNDLLRAQREHEKMPRCSEVYITGSDSDSSRSNSPENDSSAETPSESSVRTPDKPFSSPEVEIKTQPLPSSPNDAARQEADTDVGRKPSLLERRRSKKSKATLQQSMFTASLNRPCDFRYDRFSTIIEPADVKARALEEGEVSSSSGEEEDEEEDYSPIEIATPVAIRMPGSRPSVVSVLSQGQQRFSATNINALMINPPRPTMTKSHTTGSMASIKPNNNGSSCLAVETKPVEDVTPSSASITSVEASSTRSLPPAEQPAVDINLKKKSSMPMLNKFRHSRMNSIKSFIKPHSISGAAPAVPQVPASHQSRPSGSASDILLSATTPKTKATGPDSHWPASPQRSVTESALPKVQSQQERRPQTARMSTQPSVTPTFSPASVGTAASQRTPSIVPSVDENENAAMTKKKSFSNLRRRSGSLGQALRFSSSRSKSPGPEAPMPPVPLMPLIHVPTKESVESTNFSTPPPPKTPKNARKSGMMMMYSPFPPSTQKGEPVGLGLRM